MARKANAQAVGYIIGYFSNGWLVDRFGREYPKRGNELYADTLCETE